MVLQGLTAMAVAASPAPAPTLITEAEDVGPLSYNCKHLRLNREGDTGVITAQCPRVGKDDKIVQIRSFLDLNNRLVNHHGGLAWRKG